MCSDPLFHSLRRILPLSIINFNTTWNWIAILLSNHNISPLPFSPASAQLQVWVVKNTFTRPDRRRVCSLKRLPNYHPPHQNHLKNLRKTSTKLFRSSPQQRLSRIPRKCNNTKSNWNCWRKRRTRTRISSICSQTTATDAASLQVTLRRFQWPGGCRNWR